MKLYLQPSQDLTIDTQTSRTQYQFTLQANSPEELDLWVPRLMTELESSDALTDTGNDWQNKGLVAYIDIDRDTASRLGLTMTNIDNALYNAFGQRLISTIYTQASQYRVVLENNTALTPGADALSSIRLTNKDGNSVPLSALPLSRSASGRWRSIIWLSSRPPPSPLISRRAVHWKRL